MSTENNTKASDIEAAIAAGTAIAKMQHVKPGDDAPVAIIPGGFKAQVLDFAQVEAWLPKPVRKKGRFKFGDVESFCRYFNEHKSDDARVFADVSDTGGSFEGVVNFHGAEPSFNDHVCQHSLEPTTEWNRLCAADKQKMSQGDFATWLEENSALLFDPSGADLLELIRSLEGHANIQVNSAVKLQTGTIKLAYDEEVILRGTAVNQQGTLELPQKFTFRIVPFVGMASVEIAARLRYRISDRKLTFFYELIDRHLIIRQACMDTVERIEKLTGSKPFIV